MKRSRDAGPYAQQKIGRSSTSMPAPGDGTGTRSGGERGAAAGDEELEDEDDEEWSGRDDPDVIPVGQNVLIIGGARSGERGSVCSYEPDEAYEGCYGVDVWAGGRPTFVDRKSLLPRYVVTLISLVSRADLNGQSATVELWDEARQRYEVELLHDRSRIKVQPTNMVLPVGARIRVAGLVSASRHNGALARVLAHSEESGRYDVEMPDGGAGRARLRLKRENVRL
jgi:hypothetical protein